MPGPESSGREQNQRIMRQIDLLCRDSRFQAEDTSVDQRTIFYSWGIDSQNELETKALCGYATIQP